MKDAFDYLYEEGGRMMNVGLHMRLIGHPSRVAGLRRFLEYVRSFGSTVCPSLSSATSSSRFQSHCGFGCFGCLLFFVRFYVRAVRPWTAKAAFQRRRQDAKCVPGQPL